jgi:uncharacterized protein (UPF0216 family)
MGAREVSETDPPKSINWGHISIHKMPLGSEGPLKKLMEMEFRNINAGFVARGRYLNDLLDEDAPSCKAKDGSEYRFERQGLSGFADELTDDERESLRLPITLTFQMGLSDFCYIADETASMVLRRLEDFGPAYKYRQGRMLMPASLGLSLIRKYGRLIQRLFLP